jgi:hypothetical protein
MSKTLPDVCATQPDSEGMVVLAANKQARRILDKGLAENPVKWRDIADTPGTILHSPEYLAIELENSAGLWAMLCTMHHDGLKVMFWCGDCHKYHFMDDEYANALMFDDAPKGKSPRDDSYWYSRRPRNMIAENAAYSLREYGVINILRDVLFCFEGAIPDDDRFASRHLHCDSRKWRALRDRLLALGDLYLDGGTIRSRVIDEALKETAKRRLKNGQKTADRQTNTLNLQETDSLQRQPQPQNNKKESISKDSYYGYGSKESGEEGRGRVISLPTSHNHDSEYSPAHRAVMLTKLSGLADTLRVMPRGRH